MNKYFKVLFMLLLFASSVNYAQNTYSTKSKKAIKIYKQAKEAFALLKYESCINLLNEALKKDSMFVDAYLLKAEVYRNNNNYKYEADNYKKSIEINPNYFPFQFYNYGVALWYSGQYIKAKNAFDNFLAKGIGRQSTIKNAQNLITKCEYAIELKNNPVDFNPINIGEGINNNNDQYWPSLSIDGKTMVYTELLIDSTRRNFYGKLVRQEDFFVSNYANHKWQKGIPIGPPINTQGNEGAQQLSADGKTLVYTGCNRADGYGLCDIYFSYKTEDGWSKPENAGHLINTKYSEKQPCLSADGQLLYFSSNRPESIGGMDIFVSKKNINGEWGLPKNLGRTINSSGDEISPYIHRDNKTFYFSSDFHPGLGKCDIFYTKKENNKWEKPKNMGYPINTYEDEIGLVIDNLGKTAYYSSNIENDSRNIYYFKIPKKLQPNPVSYISGRILNKETLMPLKANIQLLSLKTSDTIMFLSSNANTGEYLLCLPTGANYALNTNKFGYLFHSENFSLSDENTYREPYKLDILLTPIKPGETIVLNNIFFESNSFELKTESTVELKNLELFLIKNPNIKIEIGGYTDNEGATAYNQELSEKRAKAVYEYLSAKKLHPERISYKGYGESNPIATNKTELGRSKNRRTELKILN